LTIRNLAEQSGMASRLSHISLGQDRAAKAAEIIREGAAAGRWVLMQNCHAVPSWMPQLQAILEEIKAQELHQDFRLFLTTYPTSDFPTSIMDEGIKFNTESPTVGT
jgi:dynein heavy chain, axonemal